MRACGHSPWLSGEGTLEPRAFTELIREIYPELSPSYRKIADYLVNHYRDAAFMTASEIGRKTAVDTAQVVRLAQRLGYPGFPELIAEIQEKVKQDLQKIYEPAGDERHPAAIVQRMLTHDRNNLEHMRLHLDGATVERVVNLLNTAPRIFLFGEGNTSFVAEAFAYRLLAFGISAHVISGELAAQAAAITAARPDDLYIGLGMTALSPNASIFLSMARSAGAHTLGIVSAMTNPVAGAAEYVLHAPANTVGLTPSLTAFTAILHGLTQAVAIARGYSMADWAVRTGNYLREYKIALRTQIPDIEEIVRTYSAAHPQASQAEAPAAGG
jgi:DNA-binding MurR/RpiR family transcriptional regulator